MTDYSIIYDGTHYQSVSHGQSSENEQVDVLPMHDYNFINFLSVAQDAELDFVPIVWQSILGKIGEESRAEVNESLVTVDLSFAFKCVRAKERYSESERRRNYKNLIAEVRVLGLVAKTQHPYLTRLEGISWDIASDGEVWPVLMSEKTKHGSLFKFASSKEWQSLTVIQKLKLYTEAALAIRDMHSWGIIHSDIKPTNILIFESPSREFTARVTDFDYSSVKQTNHDIYLPQSIPWNHPRLHSRAYTFSDAACTDVYSLGLLCFWMFFKEDKGYPNDRELTALKLEGSMPEVIQGFKETFVNFSSRETGILSSIFNMTLADHDDNRSSIDELVSVLQKWWLDIGDSCLANFQAPVLRQVINQEYNFHILVQLPQLHLLDPRVRKYIAQSFQKEVDQISEHEIRRPAMKAAFQLAICYTLGFGVRRDDNLARQYLEISGHSALELAEDLEFAKDKENSDLRFSSGIFTSLWDDGHVTIDNTVKLNSRPDFLSMSEIYRQEIEDYGASLGELHPFTINLRSILGSTLIEMGKWAEAKQLCETVVSQARHIYGERDEHTLSALASLAELTRVMGLWDEAETITRSLLQHYTETKGLQHPDTLFILSNLVSVLLGQKKVDEGRTLADEAVTRYKAMAGGEHPRTLIAQSNLLDILIDQDQWEQAKVLIDELIGTATKVRGLNHPDTLELRVQLGVLYDRMGLPDEAINVETTTLEAFHQTLGPTHPSTIRLSVNLAITMASVRKFKEAETLLNQALPLAVETLGPDHHLVIDAWDAKSLLYAEQGRHREAEEIDLEKLRLSREKFGNSHVLTLRTMAGLASTYSKDDTKLLEAKNLLEDSIPQLMQLLGPNHDDTLSSQQNLATVFAKSGELSKARALQEQILGTRTDCFGKKHETTCIAMSELAATYWELRNFPRTLALEKEALECCLGGMGDRHPTTISAVSRLAMTHTHLQDWEAARPLAEKALALNMEIRGSDHEETWSTIDTVAEIDLGEGRHREALTRWEDLLAFQLECLADDHESVMDTRESIEKVRRIMTNSMG